jgi:hypothetical protein
MTLTVKTDSHRARRRTADYSRRPRIETRRLVALVVVDVDHGPRPEALLHAVQQVVGLLIEDHERRLVILHLLS